MLAQIVIELNLQLQTCVFLLRIKNLHPLDELLQKHLTIIVLVKGKTRYNSLFTLREYFLKLTSFNWPINWCWIVPIASFLPAPMPSQDLEQEPTSYKHRCKYASPSTALITSSNEISWGGLDWGQTPPSTAEGFHNPCCNETTHNLEQKSFWNQFLLSQYSTLLSSYPKVTSPYVRPCEMHNPWPDLIS